MSEMNTSGRKSCVETQDQRLSGLMRTGAKMARGRGLSGSRRDVKPGGNSFRATRLSVSLWLIGNGRRLGRRAESKKSSRFAKVGFEQGIDGPAVRWVIRG